MPQRVLILDWGERFRSYILEAGRELGLRLYFVLPQPLSTVPVCVEDTMILPDLYQNPLQWASQLADYARCHHINAIFTHEDELVELAAQLSAMLGLPGLSTETVYAANDKWATRERLAVAGISGPAYRRATTLADARSALDSLRLPIVIKPANSSGGYGASKLEQSNDLEVAWDSAYRACLETPPPYQHVVLEEFLPGPLISVEAAVVEGVPTIVAMTDALQVEVPTRRACSRFVYHGLLVPSRCNKSDVQEITALTMRTIKALAISTGIVHTEVKRSSRGDYQIVEVNPRLPGIFIPELVHRALGVNLAQAALLLALGQKPTLEQRYSRGACVRLITAPKEGIIDEIKGFETAAASPHVVRAQCWVSEGDYIVPPSADIEARMGYVMTEHRGPREALEAAERALAEVAIHVVPYA